MTREEAIRRVKGYLTDCLPSDCYEEVEEIIKALEQEPQTFKWCTDCKEYDQEKHYCPRYCKVIRRTVEEMRQAPVLEEIRGEIKAKIEEEEFARSVFRREEKDTAKAEQCTGSIMAYNNVIELIDEYKEEQEEI